jgi:hypothetical protein
VTAAGLVITFDSLTPGLRRFPIELQTRLRALGEYYAERAENQMKRGAPWTDRTGVARQSLGASSDVTATQMEIVLYHGVDYGIWLEVRWSGRYAIILPTLESVGPEVMAAIQAVFA